MTSKNNSQNSDRTDNTINGNANSMGNVKDYISGDSTPSSSSHQFSRIATNPKQDSKKSAQKTNSTNL